MFLWALFIGEFLFFFSLIQVKTVFLRGRGQLVTRGHDSFRILDKKLFKSTPGINLQYGNTTR